MVTFRRSQSTHKKRTTKLTVSALSPPLVAAASAADFSESIVHIRADDLGYDKSCLYGDRERYSGNIHNKVTSELMFLRW